MPAVKALASLHTLLLTDAISTEILCCGLYIVYLEYGNCKFSDKRGADWSAPSVFANSRIQVFSRTLSWDILIHHLVTSLFKLMYYRLFFFLLFCLDYCPQTKEAKIMKIVPKDSKLIYPIKFIVAFLVSGVFV